MRVRPNIDGYILLSTCKFEDNYYLTGYGNWTIIALGNWESIMSPPSIVEFLISFVVKVAIDKACVGISLYRHVVTKGCLFDFTASIDDSRYAILTGFICKSCRETIKNGHSKKLLTDAKLLLKRKWLGNAKDPSSVADIAKKLGYDLFCTSGIKPTVRERTKSFLQEESIKALVKIVFGIIFALILIWLGLK